MEKRTILGILLFVLFVGCLIEYNICPSFLYTAFAVIAAAFLFTFTKWYERYCKK